MFLSGSDLEQYCPDVCMPTLNATASDAVDFFCALLPIKKQERTVRFRNDSVFYSNGRNKVNTGLLNIISAKIGDTSITVKTDGLFDSSIRFKETPTFDPTFDIKITSGYDDETIPGDIKKAMIDMAVDQALNQGVSSNVVSYTLGPRTVKFSEKSIYDKISSLLLKYQGI